MSRSNIILIALAALVLGVLFYYKNKTKSTREFIKWTFDYRYNLSEKAYDRDFFIDYLKKDKETEFTTLEERFSRQELTDANGLYLFYNTNFGIDSTEAEAVLDFVEKGNSALIISKSFGNELFRHLRGIQITNAQLIQSGYFDSASFALDTFQLDGWDKQLEASVTYFGSARPFGARFNIDTTNLDLDAFAFNAQFEDFFDEVEVSEEVEEYDEEEYEEYEEYDDEEYLEEEFIQEELLDIDTITREYPKPKYRLLGKSVKNGDNVLEVQYGKGRLILHLTPVLFTNVQLDKPEVFEYTSQLFNRLDYDHIYWDELKFQFLNRSRKGGDFAQEGYFQYLFKDRSLKLAFYVLIIGLLFFVVFGIKRKYTSIEIVEPLTNSSIDFSKTIARLYWLNPDHKKIAEQKVKMFLAEIRSRYGLSTHQLDDDFRQKFRDKSGTNERHIKRLFDAYEVVKKSGEIHEALLIQIAESIAYIRQNWK